MPTSDNVTIEFVRTCDEAIMIGDKIEIIVTRIDRDVVRLAIDAPREIPILRSELCRRPQREPAPRAGSPPV